MRKGMVVPAVVAGSLVAAVLLAFWLSRPAAAQLGGLAQVTRLELSYDAAADTLDARFHLATGLAIRQSLESEAAAERLLQAAQLFAQDNVRMFAAVRNDRVESWQLAVR